jgi:O-antigen ligase
VASGTTTTVTKFLFCWYLLALALLFGGASLTNLGSAYDPLDPAVSTTRWILIAGSLAALSPSLLTAIARFDPTAKSIILILLWLAFGAVCLISSVAADDHVDGIASALWILIGVPLVFFVGLPGAFRDQAAKLLVLALLISHTSYIVVSFTRYPDLHFGYKGIFGHPNGTGVTAAVLVVCCLAWIVERVQTLSFRGPSAVALGMLFGWNCFLVMVSGSRTSLFAVIVTTAASAIMCAKHLYRRHLFPALASGLVLASLGTAFLPDVSIAQAMWQKHMRQVMKGDVLSKRDEIWMKVIDDMRLLGNGSEYFPGTIGISSHNSLMHIIGQRGPIAAVFITCLAALGMIRAIAQAVRIRQQRSFSATPALISVCFWTLSMGEGMFGGFGTGITLAYLLSIGIVIAGDAHPSTPLRHQTFRQWESRSTVC